MNGFIVKDKASLFPMMRSLYHHKMMDVFKWILKHYPTFPIVITSTYRPKSRGVHGTLACRGIDLRSRHVKQIVKEDIERMLNKYFEYDFERPSKQVCYLRPKDYKSGPHFHIQVHPNTQRRVEP